MSDVPVQDYLKKIRLLESWVGKNTECKILDPFVLHVVDASAQVRAKEIADFIGLRDLTFVITPTKQEEGVAGHVELEHGQEYVFIELSPDIIKFETAPAAILAHEITHKYLQLHNLFIGQGPGYTYENEILTDIAMVFLGLGKLALNGCQSQISYQHYVSDGTQTITQKHKCGYLDLDQLAFVYLLVCHMRGHSASEYLQGLTDQAFQAIQRGKTSYKKYFDGRFSRTGVRDELVNNMCSRISDAQERLFDLERILLYLQKGYTDVIDNFLTETHGTFAKLLSESSTMVEDKEDDPCLRYLNALELDQRVERLLSKTEEYSAKAELYCDKGMRIVKGIRTFGNPFPKPATDMFRVVTCRNDGTKLRLPADMARIVAKCPKCKYAFTANTAFPFFRDVESNRKNLDTSEMNLGKIPKPPLLERLFSKLWGDAPK